MSEKIYSEFVNYCRQINDPRQEIKRIYPLEEVLFLVLCSTLSGCYGWDEISFFGEQNIDFLEEYLPFEHGIPSSSTIFRVVSLFPNSEFEEFFTSWFNKFNDSKNISIDGKTIKGSKKGREKPIHMLHACDSDTGVLIGSSQVDTKTNEIRIIPKLLEKLDINDCTITLDAMGCQRDICNQIVENGGDYVIGLKGNQGTLYDDVKLLFDEKECLNITTNQHLSKGHGRIEDRRIYATEDIEYINEQHKWPHLKTIIKTEYQRVDKENSQTETLYYISSREADPKKLQDAIRSHWKIEAAHWILDVTFNEDKSAISIDKAAENMAIMRRIALNLIKIYQTSLNKKLSVKRIQKMCLIKPNNIKTILNYKSIHFNGNS